MKNPITIVFVMIEGGISNRSDGSAVPALRITGDDGQVYNLLLGPNGLQRLADTINGMLGEENTPTLQ